MPDPHRTADHPPAVPLDADPAATTDLSRQDTSADPNRTGDYVTDSRSKSVAASMGASPVIPVIPGYEIECELGRGGMGVVYKARQTDLNRPVAIKMILGGKYTDPVAQARFLVEAEVIARLTDPRIVQVFEFGRHDDQPFFVLEFVGGGSLAGRLRSGKPTAQDAAVLVAELAEGMAAAHQKGVVHRDLKPANVLLTETGEPKITDFGLAKIGESDMTASGAIMGTPSYMSPEQAAGRTKEVGTPTDVYALGVILYELLTGRVPFRGDSVMETIQQVMTREPERPRLRDASIPRDLETICLKCLEKQPGKRYGTATELAADLRAYLDGRPISARPVGPGERVWKWVQRNPGRAAVIATAVLLLVGAVLTANEVSKQREKDRLDAELQRAEDRVAAEKQLGDAEVKRIKAQAEKDLAQERLMQAQDRAEEKLARTWLNSLAEAPNPKLNDGEIETFTALTVSGNNRVEFRFVTEALNDPPGRRKLRTRSANVMQAVIGLDGMKRLRVEQLLVDTLGRLDPSDTSRTDVALAASSLGGLSPRAASEAAKTLLQAIASANDPVASDHLAQALSALASHLDPKETATTLTKAMLTTRDPSALRSLTLGLAVAAVRLEPDESTRVSGVGATILTRAMTESNNASSLRHLALGLSAVAPRLEPKEASKAAAALREAKAKPMRNSPMAVAYLALGLHAVTVRPEPKETGRLFADAVSAFAEGFEIEACQLLVRDLSALVARLDTNEAAEVAAALTQGMTEEQNIGKIRNQLQLLSALASRLEPKDAAKVATTLARAMAKVRDPFARDAMRLALPAVVGRLNPKDAAEAAATLTQTLTTQGINIFDVTSLVLALASLAHRLEPEEAEKLSASIMQMMAKRNDPLPSEAFTLALAAAAGRLEHKEAAKVAVTIIQSMSKINNPSGHHELVQALSAVIARLEPDEATRVAADFAARLKQASGRDSNTVVCLARCLPALATHMEPKAAEETAAALAQLLDGLQKSPPSPNVFQPISEGLSALAARLEPKEATRLSAVAGDSIKKAIGVANTDYPKELPSLARSLSAVASRLKREESTRLTADAALLMQAVPNTNDKDPDALQYRLQGLLVLAPRLETKDAVEVAADLMRALMKDNGEKKETGFGVAFTTERVTTPSEVLSELLGTARQIERVGVAARRFSDRDLVELLKGPFCVGVARRTILDQLGSRYERAFADQWEFVEYVIHNKSPLDLVTSPLR